MTGTGGSGAPLQQQQYPYGNQQQVGNGFDAPQGPPPPGGGYGHQVCGVFYDVFQ